MKGSKEPAIRLLEKEIEKLNIFNKTEYIEETERYKQTITDERRLERFENSRKSFLDKQEFVLSSYELAIEILKSHSNE